MDPGALFGATRAQCRAFVACLVAAVLMRLTTLYFNGVLNTVQSAVADSARDWATLAQVGTMVMLALAARRLPQLVVSRPLNAAAVGSAAAGAALAPLGVALGSATLLLVGVCLTAAAAAWASAVRLVLCSALPLRQLFVCFAAGTLLAAPVNAATARLGYHAAVACYALCCTGVLALCFWGMRSNLHRFAEAEAAADAAVTRPRAVLPLTHDLFVYIFVFCFAYGFGLRYENADGGLLGSWFIGALMLGVLAYALLSRREPQIDNLFNTAFMLFMSGFLLVLLNDSSLAQAASTLLASSNTVFSLLMTLALCAVAARSASNALPSVAWGFAAHYAGIGLGAQVGMYVTQVAGTESLLSRGIVAAIVAAVVLYTLLSIRDFGFDKTVASVERDQPAVVVRVRYEDTVAARCRELVAEYGLTDRESDVFGLLARGNNTLRIQEELSITKNTLKYHTRHIYEKLGVHSQQELIDLL